jgi:TRAP transporter TAXI family solute receptor
MKTNTLNAKKNLFILIVTLSYLALFSLETIFVVKNSLALTLATGKTGKVTLATGEEKKVYYPIGKGIKKAAANLKEMIKVMPSKGSVDNLYKLHNGEADLCLAQSDITYYAFKGLKPFSDEMTDIRIIASLYTEAVHILIRKPLLVKSISEFRDKRIFLGPIDSGTRPNAISIIETFGISQREYDDSSLSSGKVIDALKNNEIDIAFMTSGTPSDDVKEILKKEYAYILNPNQIDLDLIKDNNPSFIEKEIPKEDYNLDKDIVTVGITALLVTKEGVDEASIYNITKSIFTYKNDLGVDYKKAEEIDLDSSFNTLLDLNIDIIAKGAKDFYTEEKLYEKRERSNKLIEDLKKALFVILFIAFIMILNTAFLNFNKIKRFLRKKEVVIIFIIFLFTWIAGSYLLSIFEGTDNNGNYDSFVSSLWSSLVNMVSFGTKELNTAEGKFCSTVMMVLTYSGIASFTGIMFSNIIKTSFTGGKKLDKISNHYVLVNWNDKGIGIIEQLHSSDLVEKKNIIIVSDSEHTISFSEKQEFDDVYCINGNPTDEAVLKRANVHKAYSVIILADKDKNIADGKSILSILAIRKICREEGGHTPIIAEIIDPQKVNLAKYAGIGKEGFVEIVSSEALGQRLLSQAAVNPGLTEIYKELLTFSGKSSEIYKCKAPDEIIGKSAGEVFKWVFSLRDNGINVIPIGISRNGKIYINPCKEDEQEIGGIVDDDHLFIICCNECDLKRVQEKALVLNDA